jgi:Do/DeqQ family serine protease
MKEPCSRARRTALRAGVSLTAYARLIVGAMHFGAGAEDLPASQAARITQTLTANRTSYADVVDTVTPAVVTIRTEGSARMSPTQFSVPDDELFRRFFGDRFGEQIAPRGRYPQRMPKVRGLGSGVIVTTDGYILTNNHVVESAESITVETTDGRSFPAKLIGTDQPSDLALLKVTGHFKALALGNSDEVKVGDVVLAVGNPLGVGQTVTQGIISAKSRSTGVGDGAYEDFLQTDAPINHGNSGGALVNMRGELVGINSQILSPSGGNIGIGFAVPVNMAKNVMEQLKASGKVTRAQLGVTIQPVTSDMAASLGLPDASGAIVSSVRAGSAAERAGVQQGDVITSFDGQPVHDSNALRNRVAAMKPGSEAQLVLIRDGAERRLSVKMDALIPERTASRATYDTSSDDQTALGISVAPSKDAKGLIVEDIDPNGRAADAGIHKGDVIASVNRMSTTSVEELRAALKSVGDRPALLLIHRGDNSLFVTVKPANG